MAYTKIVLSEEVLYLQDKTYSANSDRKFLEEIMTQGVLGTGFGVTFNSGLQVDVAAGHAAIDGGNITDQGMYRVRSLATQTIAVGAGDATNPRLDQIILRVLDNASDASGSSEARIEVIPGTPTAGATLANRNGAASLTSLTEASKSVLLLADVLVPAGASSINSGAIGDKRTYAQLGHNINIDASKIVGYLPGSQTIQGNFTLSQQLIYGGIISPSAIGSDVNDWNPSGLANAETIVVTSTARRRITGLQGGASGRSITFINAGSNSIVLSAEDTASSAANRFGINSDYELVSGTSVRLVYYGAGSRWKLVGPDTKRILQECSTSSIADDAALTITPIQAVGVMILYARVSGYETYSGIFSYKAAASGFMNKIVVPSGPLIDTSTAVLSGTTGTDTHMTVSANSNGNIYVENRLGGTRFMGWVLLGV